MFDYIGKIRSLRCYIWLMAGTSVYVSSGSAWLRVGGTSTAQQTRRPHDHITMSGAPPARRARPSQVRPL